MKNHSQLASQLVCYALFALISSNSNAFASNLEETEKEEEYTSADEIELANKIRATQEEIKKLESKMRATQENLDREHDRNGKLRQKLLSRYSQGCKSNEKIKTLEIFLQGSHLPDSDWDRANTRSEKPNEGNPTNIVFSFGREISITQSNEEMSPVFTSEGYLASRSFENFTPADISMIKITKGGRGFVSDLACWSIIGWSKWGLGKKCEWRNSETNRYALDSIQVKINSQLFFSTKQIGFIFADQNFTWQESNLAKSTDYINFMTSTLCSEDN